MTETEVRSVRRGLLMGPENTNFTNVEAGTGYYVTQIVNGVESSAYNAVTVEDPVVGPGGGGGSGGDVKSLMMNLCPYPRTKWKNQSQLEKTGR